MTKVTLNSLGTINGQTSSAVDLINANFQTIQVAYDNTLSRDGTSPNQMGASLDMNSFAINNLPMATLTGQPATYGQLVSAVLGGAGSINIGTLGGQIVAGQFPGLTGDVTANSGSFSTTVAKIGGVSVTGASGTGKVLFQTSPTINTPTITSPTITGAFTATGLVTNADLVNPSMTIAGHAVALGGTQVIASSDLTTYNAGIGPAGAGQLGELITSTVASGSPVSIASTGATVNITSISLTAGDWDVEGMVCFAPAASTSITLMAGMITATSATFVTPPAGGHFNMFSAALVPGANFPSFPVGRTVVNISATTPIYLIATANFTVSTIGAFGTISARRVR